MTDPSIEDLAARIDDLEDRVSELETENNHLEATVDSQAETIQSQREQLAEYGARLKKLDTKRESAEAHRKHLQQRVHALESDDTEPTEDTTLSPLQQLIRLPSKAVSKLTANQERARYIAKDIEEYANKVPAGFALDSSMIRKLLKAKEDQTPHTQTVTRVMDFLDRLGKQDVKVVKRRGTKRVIFTEHAVAELGSTSTSRGITDVVMGWRQ